MGEDGAGALTEQWQRGHERVHADQAAAHAREHALMAEALTKTEQANERALRAATDSLNKRFDAVNEFRATLADASARFATRDRLDVLERTLTALVEDRSKENRRRIELLEHAASNMAGRLWALGVGVALLIVVVNVALRFVG
jgi:preprotein translocase subunit SecF